MVQENKKATPERCSEFFFDDMIKYKCRFLILRGGYPGNLFS
jgi:hypothetical protein